MRFRSRGREGDGIMFLRNAWYVAAEAREVGRKLLHRRLLDEPVVLYRRRDGAAVALADRCCHRQAPLSKGWIEGDRVRCGYHGFLYEPTGECIEIPARDRIPPGAHVASYPLCEREDWIWIWIGEPARAETSLVPTYYADRPGRWKSVPGYLPVAANYLLLVDNLLDLSHVSYVHANTIGSRDDKDPDLVWERGDRWVRGTRTVRGMAPSPRQVHEGADFPIDQTKVMTYTAPADVFIDIWTREAGARPGQPLRHDTRQLILDFLTPETATTSHYFWSNVRNYRVDDDAYSAEVDRLMVKAFQEDRAMLEAQQANSNPRVTQVDVAGDAGSLQARRLLQRLIAEAKSVQAPAVGPRPPQA
jgi:vanillate O-demethylase monooxygenase subunit